MASSATWAYSGPLSPALPPTVELWKLASINADHSDDSDLEPFAKEIGNARVVGLGEQTHGAREEYQLKLRLRKYLHRKMGFDVVLLESGFYDIGELSRRAEHGELHDRMALGSVFFMYARSAEGRAMLHYLDGLRTTTAPMSLAGIDSQHTGALSKSQLIARLQAYLVGPAQSLVVSPNTVANGRKELTKRAPYQALARGADWDAWSTASKALFAMDRSAPAAPERAAFERHAIALDEALCKGADNALQGRVWWCMVARSVRAQALSFWSADHDYQRDNQMGANAIWLADHLFAGKKIVIWAHTVHLTRGFQRTPVNLQAGEVMHRRWGPAYKVVQFSAGGGEIFDYVAGKALAVPIPAPDSFEARLGEWGGVKSKRAGTHRGGPGSHASVHL